MNVMMKKLLTTFMLLLLVGTCKAQASPNPYPLTTKTPATIAPTLISLPSTSPVPPTLNNAFLKVSDLDLGLYIGFVEALSDKFYLSLASLSGIYQGQLAEIRGGYGLGISPDKLLLADLPYIVDLDTGTFEFYEELVNCVQPSWSPDSEKLAVSCPTYNYHHDDIYVFSIGDRTRVPVTNCQNEAFSCGVPVWSPDGHWLAFYRGLGGSGESQFVGLHILDITCSSGLAKCWHDESGIDTHPSFSWSPNSQLLAAAENNNVYVFQIEGGRLSLSETYEVGDAMDWVAWLGNDNELLVLEYSGEGGYVISRETGSISSLTDAQEEFFQSQYHDSMFIFAVP